MNDAEIKIGTLRQDIELISGQKNMIFDPVSDNYFKVSAQALKIMSFMTETIAASDFIDKLEKNGIFVKKEELFELYVFLKSNNLIIPEYGEAAARYKRELEQKEKSRFLRFSAAYLFFRLPPWRPENFFRKIAPFVSFWASKWMLILSAIPAVIGYLLVLKNLSLVKTTFINSITWAGLVKYFLVIIILKFIHEAAHSIAAIHFNCRVRGIGIGFMVFYPRLYTDTTDSWRLPRKQRLLIDAAGIIAEIILGGIAALLWNYSPPGVMKSTMFYIFAVSTISSLLVNGNPCIRYDGYYILCDLLNIDNLMGRSADFFKQWWRWTFLRLGNKPAGNHKFILLFFGMISTVYRVFLYTSIILVIYHKFTKFLAVIMIFLELYSIVIYPCCKELQAIKQLSGKSAGKARYILYAAMVIIFGVVMVIPISWKIELPGESVHENRIQVVIKEGGYLCQDIAIQARSVRKNDVLFQLDSPQLDFAVDKLAATIKFDKVLYGIQQIDEQHFHESKITREKIDSDHIAMAELRRRKSSLDVRAETDGTFLLHYYPIYKNSYLPRGLAAGEIVSGKIIINAYADDSEISKLAVGDQAQIYTRDSLKKYTAKITQIHQIPAQLTETPVLQSHGGTVPVYFDENLKRFLPDKTLYRIELATDEKCNLPAGRFVNVKVSHSEKLFNVISQFAISAFRKEF